MKNHRNFTMLAAVAALAIAAPAAAQAASPIAPQYTGKWCLVRDDGDGWSYFRRKCDEDADVLTLQRNGDYVFAGADVIVRCKAAKVVDRKGWTDYLCSTNGKRPEKKFQKFTIDVETGELGLNYGE
jgi:hypothetical protein